MKFRIWTILWVFALLSSGMATFGVEGVFLSVISTALWAIFYVPKAEVRIQHLIFGGAILIFSILLPDLVSQFSSVRERLACASNMKQLALGLHNYYDFHKELPKNAHPGPNGNELQSWRLWVYPYLESSNFYEQFKKDEAWDGPSNSSLVARTRLDQLFHCPSHSNSERESHYLAVTGDHSAFSPTQQRRFSEVTDGAASTIMLLEAPYKKICWAEPRDLSFEEAVALLSTPRRRGDFVHEISEGFFYKPSCGVHAAFMDGWVRLLRLPMPKEYAIALLTIDGGERIDPDNLPRSGDPELNYARIYSLSVFLVLALLPIAKLKKKHPTNGEPAT